MNEENTYIARTAINVDDRGEDILIETVTKTQEMVFQYCERLDKYKWVELFNLMNKPLKLEEIEDDMWLWDNRDKEYIQIVNKLGVVINRYKPRYNKSASTLFQVNRFYRYQPLEEE